MACALHTLTWVMAVDQRTSTAPAHGAAANTVHKLAAAVLCNYNTTPGAGLQLQLTDLRAIRGETHFPKKK